MEIGLEKEMLVFDEHFKSKNYTKKELDKNFTVDFADNQIEIISDVHNNIHDVMEQMYSLLNEDKIVYNNVWPLSQPGLTGYDIKYGVLSEQAKEYRTKLVNKYGYDYMNISGIHFNFSYEDAPKVNKHNYYFDLMKKVYVYAPLILQFVGFTPLYQDGINDKNLQKINNNKGFEHSLSLRNTTKYGYLNENSFELDYSNYEAFKESIQTNIKNNKIIDQREIYSKIRIKEYKNAVYLELRFIDLNPFIRLGITYEQLTLIKIMIDYIKDIKIDNINIDTANEEFDKVATEGLNKQIKVNIASKEDTLFNHTMNFFENIKKEQNLSEIELNILEQTKDNYINDNLDINKFINKLNEENLTIEQFGKKYSFKKEKFSPLYPNKELELSTKILIKQAEQNNIDVQILDEMENIIKLKNNDKEQLVVQATKTNKDKYVNILMMENKVMTKKILSQNNIKVPYGQEITSKDQIDYNLFSAHKIVVKPVDTNFGVGITILDKDANKQQIDKAVDFAFEYSKRLIIEQFQTGIEYRFLVIDDNLVSIIKRTPANVIGDGIHTIAELINIKNSNPIRNKGYITPLEYLSVTEIEKGYLKLQNLSVDSIIEKDKLVYLRENSNVSTGGDSEEVYDKIPQYFKGISVKVAQALDVRICGVDMIINDDFTDYSIIEANFNPAIQMHVYPYKSIGRNPAQHIIDLLFK